MSTILRGLCLPPLLACAALANAHSLLLEASEQDERVLGVARYSDQSPAAGIYVALQERQGEGIRTLAEGQADRHGHFELTIPEPRQLWLLAEAEEGHHLAVRVGAGPPETDAQPSSTLAWRDLLVGLGYVLGLLGGLALWRSRCDKEAGI